VPAATQWSGVFGVSRRTRAGGSQRGPCRLERCGSGSCSGRFHGGDRYHTAGTSADASRTSACTALPVRRRPAEVLCQRTARRRPWSRLPAPARRRADAWLPRGAPVCRRSIERFRAGPYRRASCWSPVEVAIECRGEILGAALDAELGRPQFAQPRGEVEGDRALGGHEARERLARFGIDQLPGDRD